ncbi:MAG: polyhydroxybutyrate depolymerase [Pseudomonadota bacterium]
MRVFLLLLLLASPALGCEGAEPCALGDRSYHLRVPDGWDGVSALPVLLHFHGWGRQGDLVVRHGRIATLDVAEKALLLAPNGRNKTWSFRREGSPDSEFAAAVIEDAAQRFPIDRSRVFVSGYSWGANMAWRFACDAGDGLAGVFAVSGTLPQNTDCREAPAEFRQVFGLDDGVLPFPLGPGGDTTYPVALWRTKMGCGDGAPQADWSARPFLTFARTSWDCEAGRVVMDVHPGGHFIPHDWIPIQFAQILAGHENPREFSGLAHN